MPKDKKNKVADDQRSPESVMAEAGSRVVNKPKPKQTTVSDIVSAQEARGDKQVFALLSAIDQEDLGSRFSYHAPKDGQPDAYEALREAAKEAASLACLLCPGSRERSLAVTKLEEFVFWANAAIARNS